MLNTSVNDSKDFTVSSFISGVIHSFFRVEHWVISTSGPVFERVLT